MVLNKKETEFNGIQTVLLKIISLVFYIILIPFVLLVVLGVGYLLALGADNIELAGEVKSLVLEIWKALLPIANYSLSLISPVLVLLILSGLIRWFIPDGSINLKSLTENVPSILAVFVLGSLCVLPLMGREIPNELGNIALVVVGFYFGKLYHHTDKT